jgi:hypothetical protein
MTSDSHLFSTKEQLESLGFRFHGNVFEKGDKRYLPLYEAKLFHHYDHRFATFTNKEYFVENADHAPDSIIFPRYWLKNNAHKTDKCMIVFRNTCRSTDIRTGIFAVLSNVFVGNNAPIIINHNNSFEKLLLLTNLSSFTFDYVVRNKIGGIALNFYILEQIPVIPLYRFSKFIRKFIAPRVFELVYTAWDLREFADSVWNTVDSEFKELLSYQRLDNASETGVSLDSINQPLWAMSDEGNKCPFPPFIWDEERRFQLRCDLDALFGHLYNLTRDEFAYILETFPIVRRKDEAQYGEYRTKRVILEKFDALADDPMLMGACTPLAERVSVLSPSAQPILPDSEPELDEAEEFAAQPEPELVEAEEPAEPLEPLPAQPEAAAEPEPPAAPAAVPAAKEQQSLPFNTQADSPIISDYTLYRCPICDKHILGFDLERHTREVHLGKDPGYKKIRK